MSYPMRSLPSLFGGLIPSFPTNQQSVFQPATRLSRRDALQGSAEPFWPRLVAGFQLSAADVGALRNQGTPVIEPPNSRIPLA